jgi:hypothetical protein
MLGAARNSWKSSVYDHYNMSLKCHFTSMGARHHLEFKFECKFNPTMCPAQYRDQMKTGDGTKNMLDMVAKCKCWRGVQHEDCHKIAGTA